MKKIINELELTLVDFMDVDSNSYIRKLLIWTIKKLKINLKSNISSTVFNKYEIYWINFGINIGTEFSGRRPGIIMKNNSFIRGKDIVVLPITSIKENKKYGKLEIKVDISELNGLTKNSIIKVEQIKTVSKLRIGDYIGKLEDNYIEILEQKFRKLFL